MIIRSERIRFMKDGTWCILRPALEGPFRRKPWWKIL